MTSHDPSTHSSSYLAPGAPVLPTGIQAVDSDGTVLGIVAQVWTDDATGQPRWVAVTDGLHASTTSIAPATGAHPTASGAVQLAFPSSAVLAAPQLGQHDHLGPQQEAALVGHYWPPQQVPEPGAARGVDTTMTRSAERLDVQVVPVPYARAVLRIETTTEQVMVPVTITRQHARLELLDLPAIDPTSTDPAGPLSEQPELSGTPWVTLFTDEPVVTTRPVPTERVRLQIHRVTGEQTVTAVLGHEEIAVERTTATDHRPPVPTP